mmetsp:Transcript_3131/g.11355  ORF Transcript_3131/g.11355 Transcript_3131/m.11355 type:complete len:271 (+) Transcript_3131:406-1218(+)
MAALSVPHLKPPRSDTGMLKVGANAFFCSLRFCPVAPIGSTWSGRDIPPRSFPCSSKREVLRREDSLLATLRPRSRSNSNGARRPIPAPAGPPGPMPYGFGPLPLTAGAPLLLAPPRPPWDSSCTIPVGFILRRILAACSVASRCEFCSGVMLPTRRLHLWQKKRPSRPSVKLVSPVQLTPQSLHCFTPPFGRGTTCGRIAAAAAPRATRCRFDGRSSSSPSCPNPSSPSSSRSSNSPAIPRLLPPSTSPWPPPSTTTPAAVGIPGICIC